LSVRQNQGHLIYALDDSYIHMAMAKNFAQHGVWGVTKYNFTSLSSSLLWTLMLSLFYFLFGPNEITPFILNVIFGISVSILSYVFLRKFKVRPWLTLIFLLAVVFFTPLPALVFCGQEHILHLLITICFFYFSARVLSREKITIRELSLLPVLAALLTMSRYEGLFLIFVVCCLFVVKRKPLYGLLLGGLGVLPVTVYGLLSVSRGWYFLPNSVLLKGNIPDLSSLDGAIKLLGWTSLTKVLSTHHVLFLIMPVLLMYILRFNKQKGFWENKQLMAAIFVLVTFLHMQFAKTGWFFRYEAYIVCLGILVAGILLSEFLPQESKLRINSFRKSFSNGVSKNIIPKYAAAVLLIFFTIGHLTLRGFNSLIAIPKATTNIYQQQYQMGLFLKEFYEGQTVIANDVGAINYLADIKCLDIDGFGSIEITRVSRKRQISAREVFSLAKSRQAKVALIYDAFHGQKVPRQWIKVAQWTILNNIVCASHTVSFYAVDPSEFNNLIKNLRLFSSRLPKDVIQRGSYLRKQDAN